MIILNELDNLTPGYKQLESGLFVPETFKPYPLAFDFFAGAGGFSCGLIQAGFDVIGAMDNEPAAAHTYMSNLCAHPVQIFYTSDFHKKRLTDYFERSFKQAQRNFDKRRKRKGELFEFEVSGSGWIKTARDDEGMNYPAGRFFFFGDIRETTGELISRAMGLEIGDLDLVVGGPPCQGFSTAGKRQVMDPRNSLVFEYARLICELQPKSMCMENVPGILSMVTPEGVSVVDQFCRILETGEYMSYEAARKMLGIVEKETGTKPKFGVKNAKAHTYNSLKKSRKKKKKPIQKKTPGGPRQADLFT